MVRLGSLADRLRLRLWFVPTLFALAAFVAAAVALTIDRTLDPASGGVFLFGGTAEGARSVLSTIAQSMLTFTALVFSITMLVLQQAASQLSPRVIRTFLRDTQNQAVLGLFVATFLYTLVVLRDVRSADAGESFVPGLSIWLAFVLLVASVGAFVYYIDHMAHAIRATSVMDRIAAETIAAIDRLYPSRLVDEPEGERAGPPNSARSVVPAASTGVLLDLDEDALMAAAADWDGVIEVLARPGDFVPEGAPLFSVAARREVESKDAQRLQAAVSLGDERNFQQDAAFGLRQLVDIALRALSPAVNDPTTAAQAIDRLHELLRRLATRSFPSPVLLGDDGRPRLLRRQHRWDDLVRLGVVEIRLAGAGHIQVVRRLREMLEDLLEVVGGNRRAVLLEQLGALDRAVAATYQDGGDRALAGLPVASDHQVASSNHARRAKSL